MFSGRYTRRVQNLLNARSEVRLAVFGPGIGRPFYEKRLQAYQSIQNAFPSARIVYDPIDERVPQISNYLQYREQLRPEEFKQISWADVILFLVTHHRLTAIPEFTLCRELETQHGIACMEKIGIVAIETLEVSGITFFEWQHQLGGRPSFVQKFCQNELEECLVARDKLVDMFQRVVVRLWGNGQA